MLGLPFQKVNRRSILIAFGFPRGVHRFPSQNYLSFRADGPQLIGPPILNITVAGRKAQLECQAKANPTPSENAVRWRRISHSFTHLDPVHKFYRASNNAVTTSESIEQQQQQQQQSIADSITGIRCNKVSFVI